MHRPRFERDPGTLPLQLTARDLEILRHVSRHRFLHSGQIRSLLGGSEQHILRRLQKLFHHGFLDRPRAQIRYFSADGSQPFVYGLGRAGAKLLSEPNRKRPRYDNRDVKQLYLQHTLLVADVMLAFERACRVPDAPRLQLEEDLTQLGATNVPPHWTVTVKDGDQAKRVGVVPDRVFALESRTTAERVLFFVEADRASMPVTRRSLHQSSLLRKLLAYEATWTQEIHRERFGVTRFRVLIVTASTERVQHIVETTARLSKGRGLFLFTDAATLRDESGHGSRPDVLDLPWLNSRGETERIEFR